MVYTGLIVIRRTYRISECMSSIKLKIRTTKGEDIAIELIKQGLVHPSKWARLLQNPMVGYKLRYIKGDLIYDYKRKSQTR